MVGQDIISSVFDRVISNWNEKCLSKSQIRENLSQLSYDEQYAQLNEQDLLNPLEQEDFQDIIELIPAFEKARDTAMRNNDEKAVELVQKQLDDVYNRLFEYGRRLYDGLDYKDVPDVDTSKFSSDEQWGGRRMHNYEWSSSQGTLEKKQIDAQMKSVKVDNTTEKANVDGVEVEKYTDKRLMAMDNYFNGDSKGLNYGISHEGYLNKLSNEQRKDIKYIDSLMNDSPGLTQDTILYRGGHFDIHLKPGDNLKFKGYVSTTFQEESSKVYKSEEYDMTYIIHAPKGTKGIVGNDDRFHNANWEHEYVLPRNTSMTILNIDYETMTCEVVIDE